MTIDDQATDLHGSCAQISNQHQLIGVDNKPVGFYDLRSEQVPGHRKTRRRSGVTVRRDPSTITGIVLHQTAVEYGVTPRQIAASGGDAGLALARRGLNVACHVIAFRAGFYAATHDLVDYVHHGNGYNRSTLGIEVDGRYPGLVDDPSTAPREDVRTTWGGPPSHVTDTVIATAREALRWLVTEARAEGMPVEWIYAHRQSSATRRSDPGQELWARLVLEWAVPVLGLRTAPHATVGDGRPVPLAWDPDGRGAY